MNNIEDIKSRLIEKIQLADSQEQFWVEIIGFIEKELKNYYDVLKNHQVETVLTGFDGGSQDEKVSSKLASLKNLLVTVSRLEVLLTQATQSTELTKQLDQANREADYKIADLNRKLENVQVRERTNIQKNLRTIYRTLRQVDTFTSELANEGHCTIRNNIRQAVKNSVDDLETAGLWPVDEMKPELIDHKEIRTTKKSGEISSESTKRRMGGSAKKNANLVSEPLQLEPINIEVPSTSDDAETIVDDNNLEEVPSQPSDGEEIKP